MSKGWTEERRRAQAERCRQNRPWEQSTGPKTAAGKARAAMNSYKHGHYSAAFPELREILELNSLFVTKMKHVAESGLLGRRVKNELIKRQINQKGAPPELNDMEERSEG